MPNRHRDPAKEKFWRGAMARFRASGLSIRDFCSREFLPEPNFYAWRTELARRDRTRSSRSRVQRPPPRTRSAQPVKGTFVPVRVVADPEVSDGQAAIDIILRGGVIVRVRTGFDAATLAQAIAVLGGRQC